MGRNSKDKEYDFFQDWQSESKVFAFENEIEALQNKERIELVWPTFDCIVKEFDLIEPF